MKKLVPLLAALALTLTACGEDSENITETTASSTTTSTTTTETTSSTTPTSTDVIPEPVQQQIEEAATEGRGPRPPLNEMTRVDGFGYVGIYMTNDGMDNYLCDARGYPSMDIMGDDGCSARMEWGEVQIAFSESMTRAFERQGLDVSGIDPAQTAVECIGFGCSPEQDAELAEAEGNATALFWECMDAGGSEETCLQ